MVAQDDTVTQRAHANPLGYVPLEATEVDVAGGSLPPALVLLNVATDEIADRHGSAAEAGLRQTQDQKLELVLV